MGGTPPQLRDAFLAARNGAGRTDLTDEDFVKTWREMMVDIRREMVHNYSDADLMVDACAILTNLTQCEALRAHAVRLGLPAVTKGLLEQHGRVPELQREARAATLWMAAATETQREAAKDATKRLRAGLPRAVGRSRAVGASLAARSERMWEEGVPMSLFVAYLQGRMSRRAWRLVLAGTSLGVRHPNPLRFWANYILRRTQHPGNAQCDMNVPADVTPRMCPYHHMAVVHSDAVDFDAVWPYAVRRAEAL